ncbi:MAG: hypothetical protein ACKO0Z_07040 [Betaproteobacteria bacterium]
MSNPYVIVYVVKHKESGRYFDGNGGSTRLPVGAFHFESPPDAGEDCEVEAFRLFWEKVNGPINP